MTGRFPGEPTPPMPSPMEMFRDVLRRSIARTPAQTKAAVEMQVEHEHPDWPKSRVGSEARWRMRRETARKVKK